MDTPLFVLGLVLICIGIYQIGKRIDWFKKVLKYTDTSQGFSTLIGAACMVIGIIVILESLQFQVVEAITTKSKISPMNIPRFITGVGMICFGIWTAIVQIKWFEKGLKDPYGWEGRSLIGGIGLIVIGILMIVKSF